MALNSLKGKLLLGVSALVLGSSLLIALLVTHRYSKILFEAMAAQTENLAHTIELEATDKILINDSVSLQKMLEHHMRSNPSLAYLFVIKNDRILAHTFNKGVPLELINSNYITENYHHHFKRIVSTEGEHYLDIAWPIFAGKAGILRVGLSEKPQNQKLISLWLQISEFTLGVLLLALIGTFLFVRQLTGPLTALSEATQKIDAGDVGIRVRVQSGDEVGQLAASFNRMVARIEEYTGKLENQAMELERAHQQTRISCRIVQEISALHSLNEIGTLLIKKIEDILKCNSVVLLIIGGNRDTLFVLSTSGVKDVRDPKLVQTTINILEGQTEATVTERETFKSPLVSDNFYAGVREAVIPIHYENQILGAFVIDCPEASCCEGSEIELVRLIMTQAGGSIKRALFQEEEMHDLRGRIEHTAEFSGIVGKDQKMQVIYKLIEDVAGTDVSVLIQGETGTGKEVVARAIHEQSHRKEGPFIVINCSAYPATLLESELFGHEKGAFTGAIRQKRGRFELAHGGTVFLDEVGEISLSAQIKLLRVLQDHKLERLGSENTVRVDARIIAAANKDLLQEIKNGCFREDLYYRLNVVPIFLPPLRERRTDIPILAKHFLRLFSLEQGKDIYEFSSAAMKSLLDYAWPGNVRELENSVEHAMALAKGERIEVADLPSAICDAYHSSAPVPSQSLQTIFDSEKILIKETLESCNWNKKQAAQCLGISRTALYDKLKKYQITKPTCH